MFKILDALFEGDLPFWYPQILSNFIFPLCLVTLKISWVQLKRLKSSNFEGPCLGRTPISEPPIFVMLNLFLIFTHSENLIHIALTVLKVQNFGGHVPGGSPILVLENFVRFFFFIFAYSENFMCLT